MYEFLESCCCSGDCDCQCEIVESTQPRDFSSDPPNASGGLLKEFDTWHSHLLPSMNNLRNSNDSNNSESLRKSFWVCAFLPETSSVDQWISGSPRSGCVTSRCFLKTVQQISKAMTVSGIHSSAPSYDNVCGTFKPLTQQESDEMDRVGAPSHVLLLNLRGGSSTVAETCSEK